jgi:cytochrome bd-type quinol oxidase subunit 2
MNQPDNEFRPRYSSIKHHSSSIYAKAALGLAVFNLLVWLLLLLPAHSFRDSSAEQVLDGLSFVLGLFVFINFAGVALAIMTFRRSKRRKELAIYGMLANFVMIMFNVSLIFY